ncbi:hypothetical protein SLNWT_1725 [Streptomyces albus]|uniref:Uncharacterized protein n=1 Tax=Streptomyces albus (strain ATCC 21838 / DSM 41398 / FERM P-419 / JCM 4703 / NBRC 107858) TaxID=1081613 RepID=A0A0B5ETP3_STRA4|nr:hypothetical protein SLNWT_1725 [Streptomyces albus]
MMHALWTHRPARHGRTRQPVPDPATTGTTGGAGSTGTAATQVTEVTEVTRRSRATAAGTAPGAGGPGDRREPYRRLVRGAARGADR